MKMTMQRVDVILFFLDCFLPNLNLRFLGTNKQRFLLENKFNVDLGRSIHNDLMDPKRFKAPSGLRCPSCWDERRNPWVLAIRRTFPVHL